MRFIGEFFLLMFVWAVTALATSGAGSEPFVLFLVTFSSVAASPMFAYFVCADAYASSFRYPRSSGVFLVSVILGAVGFWLFLSWKTGFFFPNEKYPASLLLQAFIPFMAVAGAAFMCHLYRMQPESSASSEPEGDGSSTA